jgi:hypothetical protein
VTERDLNPEVADDIARRSASERDPTRKGCKYDWRQPVVITYWPCALGCGRQVGVSQEEIDAHAHGNARAETYGFPSLPQALPCSDCKAKREQRLADERATALQPRQTEIAAAGAASPTSPSYDPIAAYKPTPRPKPRGGRKLR